MQLYFPNMFLFHKLYWAQFRPLSRRMMVRDSSSSLFSLLVLVLVARVAAYQVPANSARCEEVGLCVECRGFHQPWLEFSDPHSAYHCYTACQDYTFKYVDQLGNFLLLHITFLTHVTFTSISLTFNSRELSGTFIIALQTPLLPPRNPFSKRIWSES